MAFRYRMIKGGIPNRETFGIVAEQNCGEEWIEIAAFEGLFLRMDLAFYMAQICTCCQMSPEYLVQLLTSPLQGSRER